MSQQPLNYGAAPNDATGEPLRTAAIKIDDMFGELYPRVDRIVSVNEYDADPTGATDATTAFQQAEVARQAINGRLVCGAGTYRLDGQILCDTWYTDWDFNTGTELLINKADGAGIVIKGGGVSGIQHTVMQGLRLRVGVAAHRVPVIEIGDANAVNRLLLRNFVIDGAQLARDGIRLVNVYEGLFDGFQFQNAEQMVGCIYQAPNLNSGNVHFSSWHSTTNPILFAVQETPGQAQLINSLLFSNCKLARRVELAPNKFFSGTVGSPASAGASTIVLGSGQGSNYVAGDWIVVDNGTALWVEKIASVATDTLTLTASAGLPFAIATGDPVIVGYWHTVLGPNTKLSTFQIPHFERCNGIIGAGAQNVHISLPVLSVDHQRTAYLIRGCQGWEVDRPASVGTLASTYLALQQRNEANNRSNRLRGPFKVTSGSFPTALVDNGGTTAGTMAYLERMGGSDVIFGAWSQLATVAANQTAVILQRSDGLTRGFRAYSHGAIFAVHIEVSSARTAGQLDVEVYKNGANTSFKATLDATNTFAHLKEEINPGSGAMVRFKPGDLIDVRVTTDSAWAPTANNLTARLYACI